MEIQRLRLLSFRAHADSHLHFAPKINLIYGPNGAGKTNLLEAVHYLALSKSFLVASDQYALRKGCPYFEIEAGFSGLHRKNVSVRLVYMPGEGKRIFVNQASLERLAQIVGIIPLVIFAPSDHALTAEGPEFRRRFMDNILSQSHPAYLDDLLTYRRALRQRNALLADARSTRSLPPGIIASWNAELVELGARIIAQRLRFLGRFQHVLAEACTRLSGTGETPTMAYRTIARFDDDAPREHIAAAFEEQLIRSQHRERSAGRTLVGPHRDELVFQLNGLDVRRYASQGQHRTFGLALKLAQYFFLREELGEPPILLLDDLFGSLDAGRTRIVLDLLRSDDVGQSLITAARKEPFEAVVDFRRDIHQAVCVEAGRIEETPA